MKTQLSLLLLAGAIVAGCVTTPAPVWNPVSPANEAEYQPFLAGGSASISGQAFLTQRGGGVVKAAGRNVTLDPATTIGNEWWGKAGKAWNNRAMTPPSAAFLKARKTTVADADGKFRFTGLAPGRYYVRTEVTWEVGGSYGLNVQGGLVGRLVDIADGQAVEVVLSEFAQ